MPKKNNIAALWTVCMCASLMACAYLIVSNIYTSILAYYSLSDYAIQTLFRLTKKPISILLQIKRFALFFMLFSKVFKSLILINIFGGFYQSFYQFVELVSGANPRLLISLPLICGLSEGFSWRFLSIFIFVLTQNSLNTWVKYKKLPLIPINHQFMIAKTSKLGVPIDNAYFVEKRPKTHIKPKSVIRGHRFFPRTTFVKWTQA